MPTATWSSPDLCVPSAANPEQCCPPDTGPQFFPTLPFSGHHTGSLSRLIPQSNCHLKVELHTLVSTLPSSASERPCGRSSLSALYSDGASSPLRSGQQSDRPSSFPALNIILFQKEKKEKKTRWALVLYCTCSYLFIWTKHSEFWMISRSYSYVVWMHFL